MPDKKQIGIYVPEKSKARLEALANRLEMSLSDFFREAVAKYSQDHGENITADDLRVGEWGGRRIVPPLERDLKGE
jgi:predicted DNA-binding protein